MSASFGSRLGIGHVANFISSLLGRKSIFILYGIGEDRLSTKCSADCLVTVGSGTGSPTWTKNRILYLKTIRRSTSYLLTYPLAGFIFELSSVSMVFFSQDLFFSSKFLKLLESTEKYHLFVCPFCRQTLCPSLSVTLLKFPL